MDYAKALRKVKLNWIFADFLEIDGGHTRLVGCILNGGVTIRAHATLTLVSCRVVGSGAPIRDADAAAALARMRAILDVGAPLTLLWDLTKFSLPSRKQAKLGVEWAGANAQDLDRGLQGIAIVVGSPVIRSVAAFFVRVLKPPQPMCVCASVEEATAFAEERCQSVRDWSAKEAG